MAKFHLPSDFCEISVNKNDFEQFYRVIKLSKIHVLLDNIYKKMHEERAAEAQLSFNLRIDTDRQILLLGLVVMD